MLIMQIIELKQLSIACILNRFTFCPIFFFKQFFDISILYFTICAVLVCIPIISPYTNYLLPVPIVILIFISMIKEGIEEVVYIIRKKEGWI